MPNDSSDSIRFSERRRFPRFEFDARAELTDPIAISNTVGRTIEISKGGCFVSASETPAVSSIVKLQIDKDSQTFDTWVRVVYNRSDSGVGLRFIDVAADQMQVLLEWIRERHNP